MEPRAPPGSRHVPARMREVASTAAIALGHVTATDLDRWVGPEAMIGPRAPGDHTLRIALDCRS